MFDKFNTMLMNKIKFVKLIDAITKLGKVIEGKKIIQDNDVLEIRKTEVIASKISKDF